MKSSPLTFKVSKLWNSAEGTTEKIAFDAEVKFDPSEINAVSSLTGDLMLVKLKNEISAIVTDAEITVSFLCSKCLKKFNRDILIPGAEREFLAKKPHKDDDENDLYLIDMKNLTIDLAEMMRQEIILHFPFIQVCSESCKGLCGRCGTDLNKKKCLCKTENLDNMPFQDLKKTILIPKANGKTSRSQVQNPQKENKKPVRRVRA